MYIHQYDPDKDRTHVRKLIEEYMRWATLRLMEEFGIQIDVSEIVDASMQSLGEFAPPAGRLYLAETVDGLAGMACMRRLSEEIGEVKRMYVRESCRGQGIGRALLDQLLADAQTIGYTTMRLDSARFMHAAHALYGAAGFREIEPYPGSEITQAYQQYWIFMEKTL